MQSDKKNCSNCSIRQLAEEGIKTANKHMQRNTSLLANQRIVVRVRVHVCVPVFKGSQTPWKLGKLGRNCINTDLKNHTNDTVE